MKCLQAEQSEMIRAIFTALSIILRQPADLRQALLDRSAEEAKEGNFIVSDLLDTLAHCCPLPRDLGLVLADAGDAKDQ